MSPKTDPDAAVRSTDSDAAVARLSAVRQNYLHDPFIQYLVPRAHLLPPRPPLINIGTYVRTTAIDDLVSQWLTLSDKHATMCQVVSLGAGSDTRFWRIASGPQKDLLASYVELDFPEITTKKAMAIKKSGELSKVLGDPASTKLCHGGTGLHSRVYHLLGVDLRLPPSQTLTHLFTSSDSSPSPILSPYLPTLLLFECVLVYMTPEASSALIQYFVDYFSTTNHESKMSGVLGGIVYEMFGLQDSFGKVMLNNLKMRNVSLPGAVPYPTISSLPHRFSQHRFATSQALTLRQIRSSWINQAERERISKLEMLDEVEELELVLEHYAITCGVWLNSLAGDANSGWKNWGLKTEKQEDTEKG